MVVTRNDPKPSAMTTDRVWLAGRCRLATPWRITYGHEGRTTRRAPSLSSHAATYSTTRLVPIPTANISPRGTVSARPMASRMTLAISVRFTSCVAGSRSDACTSAVSSRRSACSGDTRRRASNGRSAKISATQSPTASPVPSATGSSATSTSSGRKSFTISGRPNWMATPSTAPNAAPISPITAACAT